MPKSTGSKQAETQFQPGQSGNPKGRPKGSRNKLGEAFLDDMMSAWEAQGIDAINRVIEERPQDFLKVVASILPKELNVNVSPIDQMSDDELISRIQQLDEIIRPFIAAQGTGGAGTGAEKASRH